MKSPTVRDSINSAIKEKSKQDYEREDEDDRGEDEQEGTVTMTLPLFIRLMEYAREEAKDDKDVHVVAERLAANYSESVAGMDCYDELVK